MDEFLAIERAAHEGAFGENAIPLPTPAEAATDDYAKGHAVLHGLRIAIEQPRGSVRSGKTASGKPWANRMAAHYGEFVGTTGADGDAVDCFVGPVPESTRVFVINQVFAGKFDEHKVMLGFIDADGARTGYLNSYDRGWTGLGSMVEMTIPQLKNWLSGDTTKPVAPEKSMQQQKWEGELPVGKTLDAVLYDIRRGDAGGLIFDSVTEGELLQEAESVMTLDAMTSPFQVLPRRIDLLKNVMNRADVELRVSNFTITSPFQIEGRVNIAALLQLSDGQTVTIYFRTATSNSSLYGGDELISWKWLLNKADVTLAVARETGEELNLRDVARRLMRLAAKNAPSFARANVGRAARLANIEALRASIAEREAEASRLQDELIAKRAEKAAAAVAAQALLDAIRINATEATTLRALGATDEDMGSIQGYATYAEFAGVQGNQDLADRLMQTRQVDVRNALRALGWDGAVFEPLSKPVNGATYYAKFVPRSPSVHHVSNFGIAIGEQDGGREGLVGRVDNDMSLNAQELAAQIDAMLPAVTVQNVEPPQTVDTPVDLLASPAEAVAAVEPVESGAGGNVEIQPNGEVAPDVALAQADAGAQAILAPQPAPDEGVAFLQSVIDGTADVSQADLQARMESALAGNPDERRELFDLAVSAYAALVVALAQTALDDAGPKMEPVPNPSMDMPPNGERANEALPVSDAQQEAGERAQLAQMGQDGAPAKDVIPVPERPDQQQATYDDAGLPVSLNPLTSEPPPVTPEQRAAEQTPPLDLNADTSGALSHVPEVAPLAAETPTDAQPASSPQPTVTGLPASPGDAPVAISIPATPEQAALDGVIAEIEPKESKEGGALVEIQQNGEANPLVGEAKALVGAEALETLPNPSLDLTAVAAPATHKAAPTKPEPETVEVPAPVVAEPMPAATEANPVVDVPPAPATPDQPVAPPDAQTQEQVPGPVAETPEVVIPATPEQTAAAAAPPPEIREADGAYLDSVIGGELSDISVASRLESIYHAYQEDEHMISKWRTATEAFTHASRSA